MKTATIKTVQCKDGWRVIAYSNTCQVSIGTLLNASQVASIAAHPRANFVCVGPEKTANDESLLIEDCQPETITSDDFTVLTDYVRAAKTDEFTKEQIAWAALHDWFFIGCESAIYCWDCWSDGRVNVQKHTDFKAMREWAGY